ncbi:MAG: D-TA family PLP-dependent enzyme [Spirochaetia bacterium]
MNFAGYTVNAADTIYSPCLLYFRKHIEENITKMLSMAGNATRLRPHIKTFKTMGVVDLLRAHGITKFKCATIAEAEMLCRGGVSDVFLAYPVVGPNIDRVVALLRAFPDLQLKVLTDNVDSLAELSRALSRSFAEGNAADGGAGVEVLVDIDPGFQRTGVQPEKAPEIAHYAETAPGLSFGGLHYYDGQNRQSNFDERMAAAETGYRAVSALKARLESEGLEVPRLVMGGTPTFPCYARFPDTELSPGTAVVYDWGYQRTLPDLPFVPAGLVFGRVVSRPADDRFTLDIGAKAISTDRSGQRGLVLDHEDASPILQSEEHWVWQTQPDSASEVPEVGTEVLVVPSHICPTTALHEEVLVVGPDGDIEASWPITARKRKLSL